MRVEEIVDALSAHPLLKSMCGTPCPVSCRVQVQVVVRL